MQVRHGVGLHCIRVAVGLEGILKREACRFAYMTTWLFVSSSGGGCGYVTRREVMTRIFAAFG